MFASASVKRSGISFGDWAKAVVGLLALFAMQIEVTSNYSGEFGLFLGGIVSCSAILLLQLIGRNLATERLLEDSTSSDESLWLREFEFVWLSAILLTGLLNFILPALSIREPLHEYLSFTTFGLTSEIGEFVMLLAVVWCISCLTLTLTNLEAYDRKEGMRFRSWSAKAVHQLLVVTMVAMMIALPVGIASFL